MSQYTAEFVGTLLLVLLGDSVVAGVLLKGTKSENAGWLVIVLAWGLAVTTAIYAVGSISGAHINPAITIGLATVGAFPWSQVPGYCLAQLAGAFVGAILVWVQYHPHWNKTEDPSAKLAVFCTSPAIRSTVANCVSEIIATAVLMFGVLALGANDFATGLRPLAVGALIITIGLCLGGTTGFAINPARDLGPRIAHFILPIPGKRDSDWSYAWIPVLAPIGGSMLGAFIYQTMF
jgi:glycerol uptake facilitator protein